MFIALGLWPLCFMNFFPKNYEVKDRKTIGKIYINNYVYLDQYVRNKILKPVQMFAQDKGKNILGLYCMYVPHRIYNLTNIYCHLIVNQNSHNVYQGNTILIIYDRDDCFFFFFKVKFNSLDHIIIATRRTVV